MVLEKSLAGSLPYVSVIIPAYNAEETLPATLDSVLNQSYGALEIIVVDDGSADRTAGIADSYARRDPRVVVVRKRNGGVASARNLGLEKATGTFIAPLDADDIWHPNKIQLQVSRLQEEGSEVALVYNWYRRIDGKDRIIAPSASPVIEGWVLHQHLEWNFVSNGSTPLIRASVLQNIRYDAEMASHGNGGCEDYLLQLELARRYRFACVPAFLTGYRKRGGEMSSDVARMIRSHLHMYRALEVELATEGRQVARRRIAQLQVELARNRLRRLRAAEAARAICAGLATAPAVAARHAGLQLEHGISRMFSQLGAGPRESFPPLGSKFAEVDPYLRDQAWRPSRNKRWLHKLQQFDQDMGALQPHRKID
jgi:hypothetical protein